MLMRNELNQPPEGSIDCFGVWKIGTDIWIDYDCAFRQGVITFFSSPIGLVDDNFIASLVGTIVLTTNATRKIIFWQHVANLIWLVRHLVAHIGAAPLVLLVDN